MKKYLILASALLTFTLPSFSQITPSSYVVGGSSSFSLVTSDHPFTKTTTSSFGIRPEMAWFVSEKWLIGGGTGYSISQYLYKDDMFQTRDINQSVSGFIGATQFFALSDKLYFTLEYSLGLSYSKSVYKSGTDSMITEVLNKSKSRSIGLGVSPGLTYFLNEKWMLFSRMGSLSYGFDQDIKTGIGVHRAGYTFQANSFGLGVRYVFGGK